MEPRELMQAVQELINTKTPEEKIRVLARRPELLTKENIDQLREIAMIARLSSGEQIAIELEKVAELLTELRQGRSGGGKGIVSAHQPLKSQTTVPWVRLAREYLALRKKEQIEQAIISTEEAGENEIAFLLRAWQEKNILIFGKYALSLHQKFLSAGRREEALTVVQLDLDMKALLVEYFIQFPLEQQAQFLDIGLKACQQAADIANELGDSAINAFYLGLAGSGYQQGHRLDDAKEAYQEALKLYRKLEKEHPLVYASYFAMTLHNLGVVLKDLRLFKDAEAVYQEALTIRRKLAIEPDVAQTLNNLGIVLRNIGKLEAAEAAYQEALTISRKLANEPAIARTLNNLGVTLWSGRHLEAAEAAYQEALTIRRKLANEPDVATTLNNLGVVLWNLGRLEAAEAAYQEALAIRGRLAEKQPLDYEPDVAMTLDNLGNVLTDMHRFDAAEAAYQEALNIRWKLAKKQPQVYADVAMSLNNIGYLHKYLRRFDAAKAAYQEALELYRKLAEKQPQVYKPEVAKMLNNLGTVLYNLRRLDAAEVAYQEALEIYRNLDIPDQMATSLSNLSHLWMESEKWQKSAELLEKAKEKVEQLRVETLSIDRRMQIFHEHIQIYEGLLVCLMKMKPKRTEDALLVAEAGKSRTLVDLLTLRDMVPQNVPRELTDEYRNTLFQARALESEIKQGGAEASRMELVETHGHMQELVDEIHKHNPDFLPHALTLDLEEIRELAEKAQSTLVMFRVTSYGSFVFLVSPDRKIDCVEIPEFTTEKLKDLLVKFEGEKPADGWLVRYYNYRYGHEIHLKKESEKPWHDTMESTLSKLYEQLLKRVHEHLKGKTTSLVFIPNRGLAILPLHACWWEEDRKRHYLMDEFIIRYAPSLSIFKKCLERERTVSSPDTLLGVANPNPPGNLVFSEWECNEIERMLGSGHCEILWNNKATKKEFMERVRARSWQLLHFSCHGQYRLNTPLESAIYFAGEEALTLGEIFEHISLPATWLVVLSACETGLIDYRDIADEHYGLPAGFLYAGAATVYGSLWTVNDMSTALLMRRVYGILTDKKSKSDALSKARALNEAQCWLRDITAGELAEILSKAELDLGRTQHGLDRMTWTQITDVRRGIEFGYKKDDRPFIHPYWWAGFQHVGV